MEEEPRPDEGQYGPGYVGKEEEEWTKEELEAMYGEDPQIDQIKRYFTSNLSKPFVAQEVADATGVPRRKVEEHIKLLVCQGWLLMVGERDTGKTGPQPMQYRHDKLTGWWGV